MRKDEFLAVLRSELEKYKINDIDSVLEYYDELIEDRLEGQEKKDEALVIEGLGSISEITKNIILDQKIEKATEKPSISNGLKAVFAFLAILSLPALIGIGIAAVALMFAAVMLLGSLLLVGVSMVFAFTVAIIGLIAWLILGKLTLGAFFFSLGIVLVFLGLSIYLLKWLSHITKNVVLWSVEKIRAMANRKEVNHE